MPRKPKKTDEQRYKEEDAVKYLRASRDMKKTEVDRLLSEHNFLLTLGQFEQAKSIRQSAMMFLKAVEHLDAILGMLFPAQ